MNMISTGAFLNEMDASSKQSTSEKFVAVWEKKNAKAARAGGVSLMALSLAACGGSSSTTTTTTTTPAAPTVDAAVTAALQISSTTGTYDNITGGSGDDTFVAGAGALETGDAVDGGAGSDTLTATYTASATVIAAVSNVETINVRSYGSNVDVTLDMDSITGADAVYVDRMDNVAAANQASVTVNNLVLGTTIGVKGGAAAASSAGDATFTFKSTTGSADSVTLDLQGALVNDVTIAAIETINIASGTSANLLSDLVVDGATKIVVTGDQNLTITNVVDMKDTTSTTTGAIDGTVDASALTGKLTFSPDANDNVSITGGSGDDTFAMTSGLDKYDLLDGGAGDDTVSVTAVADGTTLDLSTYSFTSVETFQVEGATGGANDPTDITIAADAAGISKLILEESQAHADGDNGTDEGTFTVTGLSSGNTVRLVSDKEDTTASDVSQIGAVTLSLLDGSSATDTLTVELAGTTGQTAVENTVDDLAVTEVETLNLVSTHTGTKASSVLTATDDNTLGDISTDTKLTTLNISGTDQASITVGSEATKLATVNTSGMSNDLSLTLQAAADQTVTGGDAKETVAFGATLNNKDTVDLGAGEDTISATSTSLTATTGALNISNVETINLTNGGTSVIDATAISGASEIAVLTNTTSTTITGLAAGTAVGIGHNNTDGASAGLFDIALADASGTADALTFNLNDTDTNNTNSVELKATGIETVTLKQTDTTDTALADYTFDVDSLNASKIIVEGAKADTGNAITLTALDTDTTAVDATGFYGILTAAAGTAIATSFDVRGGVKHDLTGSSKNDTFNVTTAMTNDDATINGNGGTDTLTMVLGTGAQDFDSITDVDTINFTSSGTVAITTDATDALDGINEATKVTFSGGNSISTITLGGSNDQLTDAVSAVIDLSGFAGKLSDATWTVDDFDNDTAGKTIQVIGTANKDTVSASYDGDSNPAVQLNTQGVEVFDVLLADSGTEVRIDMSLVTGMTTINVTDTSDERVEFYNMSAGTTIDVTSTDTTNTTVEVVYEDDTGSADEQTFIVAAASANDNVALVIDDIEIINISSDTAAQVDLSLAGVSMTAAAARNTVNFTGTNDIELAATGADVTTINASGMGTGGALIQTGRTATEASTYTGSGGNDTFIMMHANDVLDGGAGSTGVGDTLDINMTQAVGTAIIDLSSTTDQVTSFNGGANGAVQKGFENVDLAGLLTNGAVVTGSSAVNTITGSGLVDQIDGGAGNDVIGGGAGNDVIGGGAGDDDITGGAGDDTITLGSGSDEIIFSALATSNGEDTVSTWTAGALASGGDIMDFSAFLTTVTSANSLSAGVYTAITAAKTTVATANQVDALDDIVFVKAGTYSAYDAQDEVADLFTSNGAASGALKLSSGGNAVVIIGANDGTTLDVWYVDSADTTIADSEVVKVASITSSADAIDSMVKANFEIA